MPITGNGSVKHSQIVICPGNGIPERIVCGMGLNPKHHNVHPLSNPNHPGRLHRHTDKLPNGINQSESVGCGKPSNSHKNANKPHKVHPLSNPNHPGRVHRHTDKLPSPITGSSGENTVCKRNEPKKIVCTMSLNQQPHRFYPLSNPIQVHKKSSNETICVFKEAVVSC